MKGREENSLKVVLNGYIEVKSIPSVYKAQSDKGTAPWKTKESERWV